MKTALIIIAICEIIKIIQAEIWNEIWLEEIWSEIVREKMNNKKIEEYKRKLRELGVE